MHRIFFAALSLMVVVLLGFGSPVAAQTCPSIGSVTGETWNFSATLMRYCNNADPAGLDYPITKSGTWTFYQAPGDCFFSAERTVVLSNRDRYIDEQIWYTGLIYGNGRITMQAQPSQDNPPGTFFGEITQYSRRPRMPSQIGYISNSAIGDYDYTGTSAPRCAFTGKGSITR